MAITADWQHPYKWIPKADWFYARANPERHNEVKRWCYQTFGRPAGYLDPRTMEEGDWYLAPPDISTPRDNYIAFRNEGNRSIYLLRWEGQ